MATRKSTTAPAPVSSIKLPPEVLALLTDEQKMALVQTAPKAAANGSGFDLDSAKAEEVYRNKRSERTSLVVRRLTDGKAVRFHLGVEVTPEKGEPFYKKGGPMLTVAEFKAVQGIS